MIIGYLTLLHSERPKLYTISAFLSAIGLMIDEYHGLAVLRAYVGQILKFPEPQDFPAH